MNKPCCIRKLLIKPYSAVSRSEKIDLITQGRPFPIITGGECSTTPGQSVFDTAIYQSHEWLCGSVELGAVFCWPCLLFAKDRISYWTKMGFKDWDGLPKAVNLHESFVGHIRSCVYYGMFVSANMTPKPAEKVKAILNPTILKNHKALRAIINAIHLLVQIGALQDSTTNNFVSSSNFLAVLRRDSLENSVVNDLLTKIDLVDDPHECIQFLLDVIESLTKALQESIKAELKNATYASLILEESPDTPGLLAVGVRYLAEQSTLVERFLGFVDTCQCDAATGVQEYIDDLEVGNKLVAQAWGAVTCPVSRLDEAQRTLKAMTTAALFLPYNINDMIFIVTQAVSVIPAVKSFFASLRQITSLFDESEKLTTCMDGLAVETSFSPSAWDYHQNPTCVIHCHRLEIIRWYDSLLLHNAQNIEANLLGRITLSLQCLREESFIFYLTVFEKIFTHVHKLTATLNDSFTSGEPVGPRGEIVISAVANISQLLQSEWSEDTLPPMFHSVITQVISIVAGTLVLRLDEIDRLKFLELFEVKNYRQYVKAFPDDLISRMFLLYGKNFEKVRLKSELLVIYGTPELSERSPPDLLHYLCEEELVAVVFPQVLLLLKLLSTLPTNFSPTSGGRLFDRLRNHTRNYVGQVRTTDLTLLDAELALFTKVKDTPEFFNAFIDDFSSRQREMELKNGDD